MHSQSLLQKALLIRKEWIEEGEEKEREREGGRNGGGWEKRIKKGRSKGERVRGKSREN